MEREKNIMIQRNRLHWIRVIGLLVGVPCYGNPLIELAYQMNLFSDASPNQEQQVSSVQPIANGGYCINFMWVNRHNNPEQLYIFPAGSEQELKEKFLNNIYAWASLNKNSTIFIWYDGNFSSQAAIARTNAVIEADKNKYVGAQIILKNVRTLPVVQDKHNQVVFAENVPVYFRVDLLRVIAAVYMVTEGKFQYFVYGDLDMKPLSEKELFDTETVGKLRKYGIVMAEGGSLGFEDGFYIISNQNKNLLEALNFVIIELSIIRAKAALEKRLTNASNRVTVPRTEVLQQIIYDTYPSMFYYFFYLEKKGVLMNKMTNLPYDKTKDGLNPFAPFQYPSSIQLELLINNNKVDSFAYGIGKGLIPTKKVPLPEALLEYNV